MVETIDDEPVLHYKGRRFEIESNGTCLGTKVKVDGVEHKLVSKLILTIDCEEGFVKVVSTELDVQLNKEGTGWVP